MNSSPTDRSSPPPAAAPTGEALIRLLREELVKTQLIVLELNDRVLAKETEKADAVAILGRVELVLEQKIDYITELDRALNTEIASLRQKLASAEKECGARDAIIQDLAARLEAANQEVTRMHGVAGDYARQLAETRHTLAAESARQQQTQATLDRTAGELAERTSTLTATAARLAATEQQLAETRRDLDDTQAQLANERRRLATIFASVLWRWGRPWRAWFGPKV